MQQPPLVHIAEGIEQRCQDRIDLGLVRRYTLPDVGDRPGMERLASRIASYFSPSHQFQLASLKLLWPGVYGRSNASASRRVIRGMEAPRPSKGTAHFGYLLRGDSDSLHPAVHLSRQ